jgi:hypothetical protein
VVNTNTVDSIASDGIGPLNIGTSASRTTLNPIMIGGLSSLIRFCGNFACSIDGATQTLSMRYLTQIERISPPTGNPLNIADTQLSGALNIGTSPTRSGDITIANTQTSGVAKIIFVSLNLTAGGTQKIITNRPLSIGCPNTAYLTDLSQIGSEKATSVTSLAITNNGVAVNLYQFLAVPIGRYMVYHNIENTSLLRHTKLVSLYPLRRIRLFLVGCIKKIPRLVLLQQSESILILELVILI